jgi:hypothetical protein
MRAAHSLIPITLTAFALALLSPSARPQRGTGFTVAPSTRPAVSHGAPIRGRLTRAGHARRARAGSAFWAGYYPDYDSADSPDTNDRVAPARISMQAAATTPPPAPTKIPEPLVMELRGDHWVRLASTSSEPNGPYFDPAAARTPPAPLPAAILIFRDGHQEEVSRYTIVGRFISIKSDYWTTGSWTRKIAISDLDLPATLKLNQARGANFALPSRPGEVMMRP